MDPSTLEKIFGVASPILSFLGQQSMNNMNKGNRTNAGGGYTGADWS